MARQYLVSLNWLVLTLYAGSPAGGMLDFSTRTRAGTWDQAAAS